MAEEQMELKEQMEQAAGGEQAAGAEGQQEAGQAGEGQQAPMFTVILASASPRRRELLEERGIPFLQMAMDVDEKLDEDAWADPYNAVKKVAERKAGAAVQVILDQNPGGIYMVIGADTAVVLGNDIFGKPANYSHAKHMLRSLSGRTHQVMTGVSVWMIASNADDPEKLSVGFRSFTEVSAVTFHELSDEQIDAYIKTGEARDKAGAYGIQGKAGAFVKDIHGSRDTVIGLPVEKLIQEFPELLEL